MLMGAAIGSYINNIYIAIILAFLSHYLLDLIPHADYSLKDTHKKGWIFLLPNILKISLDLLSGILLIFIFSKATLPASRQAIIYICAFFAILPDGLTVLNNIIPNKILEIHRKFHIEKIHYFKENPSTNSGQRKISIFWRILSEIAVVIISIFLLRF